MFHAVLSNKFFKSEPDVFPFIKMKNETDSAAIAIAHLRPFFFDCPIFFMQKVELWMVCDYCKVHSWPTQQSLQLNIDDSN